MWDKYKGDPLTGKFIDDHQPGIVTKFTLNESGRPNPHQISRKYDEELKKQGLGKNKENYKRGQTPRGARYKGRIA